MKKIILVFLLLLVSFCIDAQNPYVKSCFPGATVLDTFSIHPVNYLCHDNPWYDNSAYSGVEFLGGYAAGAYIQYDGHSHVAYRFLTDEPLEVIGVAGAPLVWLRPQGFYPFGLTIDSTIAGRVPEYFHLYEATHDTFMLVADVRWDTCSQIRKIHTAGEIYDICEAYLYKSVTVEDSFYVGYTTNNNIVHRFQHVIAEEWEGCGPGVTGWFDIYEHPHTNYRGIVTWDDRYSPRNNKVKYKNFTSATGMDTLWHTIEGPEHVWQLLWPIFDTTGMACRSVSQLAVTPIENQSTTLTWSAPTGQTIWDVQYGRSDAPRSSYTQTRVRNTPYLNLSNLDTGTYYTVFVRAMCDIGDYSNWSDSLVFYVPGDSSNVGIRAVEQYTNLFPNPASDQATVTSSFGIKGIEVYSLKGELMEHSTRDGGTVANIDLQRYPAGSYIVRIRTAKGIVARHLEVVR